ncbi:lactate utilization protein LutB domain-containing protein, partial [Kitasatospora misakiensis]
DACPVKINIPEVLAHLRAQVVEAKAEGRRLPTVEALAMKGAAAVLVSPARLRLAQRAAGLGGRALARRGRIGRLPLPGPLRAWSDTRDTPAPPAESFRSWWRANRAGEQE